MAKVRRSVRGPVTSTRLPIPNILSVGRQPANKRQPYEAEVLDNTIVSLERNFEKRSGFQVVPQSTIAALAEIDFTSDETKIDLFSLSTYAIDSEHDLWFYWYNINEDQRYLVVIDFSATGVAEKLFYIFQINSDSTWTEITSQTQWDTEIAGGNAIVEAYRVDNSITYAEAAALGSVSADSRAYLTYGSAIDKTARNSLKAVTLGSTVVILNKNVHAGFSSDVDGKKFDLAGVVTADDDIKGRRVVYYTAAKVSKVYSVGFDELAATTDDVFLGYRQDTAGSYIPVQDFVYYKNELAKVGQRVNDASVITLPPEEDDWYNNNTNITTADTKAKQMLTALYDEGHPHEEFVDGRGKVYFALYPFLSLTSGYYRIQSFSESAEHEITAGEGVGETVTGLGRPYLQKIRTPDEWSYIDPARMPQQLSFTIENAETTWNMTPIKWTPRETGDKFNNPGPSIFRTIDGKSLRHVKITSMAVFKDRLFFAADDLVFSSRLGVYEDLFLNDATQITESDPIDIRASSNTFAQISSMTPFEDYLFIDTKANIQFTMSSASQGNVISPLSVSVDPVTYYSTAAIVEPQMIGSQLFFWDTRRLYLYLGQDKTGLAKAVELSLSVKDYLPSNFRCSTTAPSQDTIVTVDDDNPNHIYMYTIRFSGDRVIQNSFYRFVLHANAEIVATQAYGDYLYILVFQEDTYLLQRCYLKAEDTAVPKLDDRYLLTNVDSEASNYSCHYDDDSNQTIWRVPASLPIENGITNLYLVAPYVNEDAENIAGTLYTPEITLVGVKSEDSYYTLVIPGNFATEGNKVYIGNPYTMTVELSPVFLRDESGNIVDGVLNLRSGVARHSDTGNYRIEVTNRGRPPLVTEFSPQMPDYTTGEDTLDLENVQHMGEMMFRIFGYSDVTTIEFISDYITPCNITAIELKGKFKQKYSILDH